MPVVAAAVVATPAMLVGMPVIPLAALVVVRVLVAGAGHRPEAQREPVTPTAPRAAWVKVAPPPPVVVAVVGTTAAVVAAALSWALVAVVVGPVGPAAPTSTAVTR